MIRRHSAEQNIISKELRFDHKVKCKYIWQSKEPLTMCWWQEWKVADVRRHPEEDIAKLILKGVELIVCR